MFFLLLLHLFANFLIVACGVQSRSFFLQEVKKKKDEWANEWMKKRIFQKMKEKEKKNKMQFFFFFFLSGCLLYAFLIERSTIWRGCQFSFFYIFFLKSIFRFSVGIREATEIVALSKVRESRVRVEESRTPRVPTDFSSILF